MAKKLPKAELEKLPCCAAEFIRLVIKKMRYRKKVRADVMAELIAHFEDELKDCTIDEEREEKARKLVAEFGDAKLLGILLRRAKKRCRPLWRTVVAKTFQAAAVLLLCLIVYTVWFFSGEAVIDTDYVAELNRMIRPVADESLNAAPLYNRASELSKKPLIELFEFIKECKHAIPEEKWRSKKWEELRRAFERISDRAEYEDGDKKQQEWDQESLANGVMTLLAEEHDQITPEQKQLIEKWLESNSQVLELLIAGTKKPYYWPDYQSKGGDMMSVQIFHVATFRRLAYGLRWHAWLNADQGRYDDAFGDIKSCYRLGRHLKGDKTIIEQLVGITIEALAIQTLQDIISGHKINSATLALLQRDFKQMICSENFAVSVKFEKLAMYDSIQRYFTEDRLRGGHISLKGLELIGSITGSELSELILEGKHWTTPLHVLFTHPNKNESRKMVDRYFGFWNDVFGKTPAQIYTEGIDTERQAADIIKGNLLLENLVPALGRINEVAHRRKTEIETTLTIIAILRYQQDTTDYPQNLQELIIAGYLKELPLDPFSDKPLVYKKTEDDFVLYSVGRNFIDDGGQVYRDDKGRFRQWAEEGDAVFWPVAK